MSDVKTLIEQTLQAAVVAAFGEDFAGVDTLVSLANNPKFGDYQANLAMPLSKKLGQAGVKVDGGPRGVAQAIIDKLDAADLFDKIDIAGPGFMNFTMCDDVLCRQATALLADPRLGIHACQPQTVVVDYSSPNVAKEMHVGHLRSTVIGDAITRVLGLQGHKVIRQNHVGDWGTQFGMLIQYLDEADEPAKDKPLTEIYQDSKKRFDDDADFATRARERVVALQAGDEATLESWRKLVTISEDHFQDVYARLGVKLTLDDIRGESSYNDQLAQTVELLDQAGELKESEGAAVVYPKGFTDREGDPMPMIVRKSDGGYLYASTDLAAGRYRINELKADRIAIVTDARQAQHFATVYQMLRQLGWAGDHIRLDHVPFGTVMGPDKRPFKTRDGGTIKLIDLIEEAQRRAIAIVQEKNTDLAEDQKPLIGQTVGIGCLKYADLSSDRIKDYVFDWDRMISFEGNTAAYIQYSYTRIRSIFRKGAIDFDAFTTDAIRISDTHEKAMMLKLGQFASVVDSVADSLEPHRLCTYLYELASLFHKFFEHCPVLKDDVDDATRTSRLGLCKLAARTLSQGLDLLGIGTLEQM